MADFRNEAERKHFATLQARAALAGWAVERVTDDKGAATYPVTFRGTTRTLDTLHEIDVLVNIVTDEGRRPMGMRE